MVKNLKFLDALKASNQGRPPVWLMRQAGRYMRSYRQLREKHTLSEMFHHEELIEQVTLMPVEQLDVDAAILFSDILLPLEVLGFRVDYEEGPKIFSQERSFSQEKPLKEHFAFLIRAIQSLKKNLLVPLIGFAGAPFTLATYLLEKEAHHKLKATKSLLYEHPKQFFELLERLTPLVIDHLKLQIEAGVDAVQIFDSWAGALDHEHFRLCTLEVLKKILEALKPTNVPIILFCRGSCLFAEELAELRPTAISFDWQRPLGELKHKVPYPIGIQGNLDPDCLRAPLHVIKKTTKELLETMRGEKRFIANLGHGVMPDISEEAVRCFVETVQTFE